MSDLYHGEHPTDMTPTEARAAVERLDRLIEQAEMAASAQLERARLMSDRLDRARWIICCFIMPRWMLTMIGKMAEDALVAKHRRHP